MAANSKTSICNLALIRLGEKTITDVTDDSNTARLCNYIYDQVLDEVLASGPEKGWKFARGRVSVTVSATEPAFEFEYQYQIPTNVLRVYSVQVGEEELTDWVREGEYILTDEEDEEVDVKYIQRITDAAKFPPYFVKVLYMNIAIELAYNLIQSATAAERLELELREKILPKAMGLDEQEKYVEEESSSWIDEGH